MSAAGRSWMWVNGREHLLHTKPFGWQRYSWPAIWPSDFWNVQIWWDENETLEITVVADILAAAASMSSDSLTPNLAGKKNYSISKAALWQFYMSKSVHLYWRIPLLWKIVVLLLEGLCWRNDSHGITWIISVWDWKLQSFNSKLKLQTVDV